MLLVPNCYSLHLVFIVTGRTRRQQKPNGESNIFTFERSMFFLIVHSLPLHPVLNIYMLLLGVKWLLN
jgi:hypothetical protein